MVTLPGPGYESVRRGCWFHPGGQIGACAGWVCRRADSTSGDMGPGLDTVPHRVSEAPAGTGLRSQARLASALSVAPSSVIVTSTWAHQQGVEGNCDSAGPDSTTRAGLAARRGSGQPRRWHPLAVLDVDATIVIAPGEKDRPRPHSKNPFGLVMPT